MQGLFASASTLYTEYLLIGSYVCFLTASLTSSSLKKKVIFSHCVRTQDVPGTMLAQANPHSAESASKLTSLYCAEH